MKKNICKISSIILAIILLSMCVSCMPDNGIINNFQPQDGPGNMNNGQTDSTPESADDTEAEKVEEEKTEIPEGLYENINTLVISCLSGTDNCWAFDGNTLRFSGITENTVCAVSGEFDGKIVVDTAENYNFELELQGVTLFSDEESPITFASCKNAGLSAKKDSKNYIYDTRKTVSSTDETSSAYAVYSACDLELGGKGEMFVISENNNGIHSKDTLSVKNITLSVTCNDNALKGNDGVNITGGVLTLIAKQGDGIKTSNTSVSTKGNQKGSITVTGGTVNIYAACDGIDAAYNAEIGDDAIVNIYTDKYSPYSETVDTTESGEESGNGNLRYIRFTSKNYNYSVKYYNSDSDYVWKNCTFYKSVNGGRTTYYYYSFDKLTEYSKVQFFIYSSGQAMGQEEEYAAKSDYMTWNSSSDTFALESRGGSLSYSWTNYSSSVSDGGWGGPGGVGGPGGMNDGNSDKGEYSTKGIKSGNEILIYGGTILIKSYDDSIHTNSDGTLENGSTPTGNVIISGGVISVFSKDDGIHADGKLTVSGGKIDISGCYEGLEGVTITISGGEISVVSTDDGFNSTATTGTGITFEGGKVNIFAGGDGIDANSRTSYQGIVFNDGEITVVSTSSMNSSIDTEQGYAYNGGKVLAICPSNGMGSESTNCKNFSTIGKKQTASIKQNQTVSVYESGEQVISVTVKTNLSALVIYLGSSSAEIKTS